jgi:hypothetical protein
MRPGGLFDCLCPSVSDHACSQRVCLTSAKYSAEMASCKGQKVDGRAARTVCNTASKSAEIGGRQGDKATRHSRVSGSHVVLIEQHCMFPLLVCLTPSPGPVRPTSLGHTAPLMACSIPADFLWNHKTSAQCSGTLGGAGMRCFTNNCMSGGGFVCVRVNMDKWRGTLYLKQPLGGLSGDHRAPAISVLRKAPPHGGTTQLMILFYPALVSCTPAIPL